MSVATEAPDLRFHFVDPVADGQRLSVKDALCLGSWRPPSELLTCKRHF
jgi:hypothetical protein